MDRKNQSKPGIIELARYALKNLNYFKAIQIRDGTRVPIFLANRELSKLHMDDPVLPMRTEEYNQAVLEYYSGKFLGTKAARTGEKSLWKRSFNNFNKGKKLGQQLLKALKQKSTDPIPFEKTTIKDNGTEIKYADDVPLVPEITPVIVIRGSDYEMGYQYAQQLVQIFGAWILEERAGRKFSEKQFNELRRWEEQHKKYTPWLIDFVKGWTQGATDAGVPMKYDDIMYLWVGDQPPSYDFLSQEGLPEIPPMACSGMAAWGRATKDGKLVTGSSGDHDLSYQVIIVAYPDHGNSFIYSAFGATGAIAAGGDMWFFGHPAMNEKGLAYVHHGGGPKFLEKKEHWGYGVRRAASVIHIMRYADSAKQALEIELSMPIGDVGKGDQGTVGGFYADNRYGYVIEGRKDPVAIRESGLMGETDFLYANNSVIHPDAIKSEWMSSTKDSWVHDPHGGWRPKTPTGSSKSLALFFQWASGRLSTSNVMVRGMKMAYDNSVNRNLFMFKMLEAGKGHIDQEYMMMLYRKGGKLPEGQYDKIVRDFKKTGNWGEVSSAHASNVLTAVMKPSQGLFSLCTGPAKKGMTPILPSSILPIYNETNAFYELKLGETPESVLEYTKAKAGEFIVEAEQMLESSSLNIKSRIFYSSYLKEAKKQYNIGIDTNNVPAGIRAFTRAQVRARQVINAFISPPTNLDELRARSHNTLRQHLELLVDQRAILRSKQLVEGRGRPRFAYWVPVDKSGLPCDSESVDWGGFSELQ